MNVTFARPNSLKVVPWKTICYRSMEKMCQNTSVHIAVPLLHEKVTWVSLKKKSQNEI